MTMLNELSPKIARSTALYKGHSNPSTESNFCKGVDSMSSCHSHFGLLPFVYWSFWLVLLQSDAITYIFKTSLTEKAWLQTTQTTATCCNVRSVPIAILLPKSSLILENLWFTLTPSTILQLYFKKSNQGWQDAQWVETLVPMPDNLEFDPRTHREEGKNILSQIVLWPLPLHCGTSTHVSPHTQI